MNLILVIYLRVVLFDMCCMVEDVFCFYDEKRWVYVVILKEDIIQKEKLFLNLFLIFVEEKGVFFLEIVVVKRWWCFLLEEGLVFEVKEFCICFIYYDLLGERDWGVFMEVFCYFWLVLYIVVWMGRDQGVIVEEEKFEVFDQDDIVFFVKVFEVDFYFSVCFFIGRYYGVGECLCYYYWREQ